MIKKKRKIIIDRQTKIQLINTLIIIGKKLGLDMGIFFINFISLKMPKDLHFSEHTAKFKAELEKKDMEG